MRPHVFPGIRKSPHMHEEKSEGTPVIYLSPHGEGGHEALHKAGRETWGKCASDCVYSQQKVETSRDSGTSAKPLTNPWLTTKFC